MTPLEALEKANNDAGIKSFTLCRDLNEFQMVLEKYRFEDFPINVLVPLTFNGTTNRDTGIRNSIVPLQGWVLTRIKKDPQDVRSYKIEDLYIHPQRQLAAKFIKGVLASEITNPQVTTIGDTISTEYGSTNALLFGVRYTMNWPVLSNVCLC